MDVRSQSPKVMYVCNDMINIIVCMFVCMYVCILKNSESPVFWSVRFALSGAVPDPPAALSERGMCLGIGGWPAI